MDDNWQIRTELLIGKENINKLANSHVLVAGLGGVGSYTAEQLCRAGIGKLTIVDGDTVHRTNRNRQLAALLSTEGIAKTEVVGLRLKDINPGIELNIVNRYLKEDSMEELLQQPYDFVVDAIDTLAPKVKLLFYGHKHGQRVVSSMGAGGKFDPLQIEVVDISETKNCRLAYYIRKKLHTMDVWTGITTVYSPEVVSRRAVQLESGEFNKKSSVGTISYMPAIFGCICASVVIREIMNEPENNS